MITPRIIRSTICADGGGCSRKASKEVSETRLAPIDAEKRKRTLTEDDVMDTSATVTGHGAGCAGMWWRTWVVSLEIKEGNVVRMIST